jgi:hypothetical protein
MKKDTSKSGVARYAAIAGNIIFIAWLLVNAIDERFSGLKPIELASMVGLLLLLGLNLVLLLRQE